METAFLLLLCIVVKSLADTAQQQIFLLITNYENSNSFTAIR